jgi:Fe-S cluster assembly iron-binding protein IscA
MEERIPMPVEITEQAIEVLRNSLQLAGVDMATGGARLHAARALGGGLNVQVELADAARQDEDVVETDGVRVFIDRTVTEAIPDAIVAVEPQHDRIVVRPAGP